MRTLTVFTTSLLLCACASAPVSLEGTDRSLQPGQVLDSFATVRGNRVAWGGVIVATDNQAEHTRIEVLAYPLDDRTARPQTEGDAQGRFVVHRAGYLEPVDYAPGRILTVTGTLEEIEAGTVGEADYRYPVVRAEELHLWKPRDNQSGSFNFGFGILISN